MLLTSAVPVAPSTTTFDTFQAVYTLAAAMSAMRRLEAMSQGIVGSDSAYTNELRLALNSAAVAAIFFEKEGTQMLEHVRAAIEQNFAKSRGATQ